MSELMSAVNPEAVVATLLKNSTGDVTQQRVNPPSAGGPTAVTSRARLTGEPDKARASLGGGTASPAQGGQVVSPDFTPNNTLPLAQVAPATPTPQVTGPAPEVTTTTPDGISASGYEEALKGGSDSPGGLAPVAKGPIDTSVLDAVLGLIQGGAYLASAYNQGKAGNDNPTAFEQQQGRMQELKMQQNQFQQQLAMQQAQYKFDTQLKQLEMQLAKDLQKAQNENEIAILNQKFANDKAMLWAELEKQIAGFNRMFGNKDKTQLSASTPLNPETIGMWNAAK